MNIGGKGARTPDLLDAIETLSQLSYAPYSYFIRISESSLWVNASIRCGRIYPFIMAEAYT